jgi:thiamine-phosphate pyrophosphorylase
MALPDKTLRIIDANRNRIAESLRLLEDLARLLLNDANLTRQIKAMRHQLITTTWPAGHSYLQARDAAGDVGAYIEVGSQAKQRGIPETVIANASRVQESLRVIEELAKLPGSNLDADKYKKARFKLYAIERDLISRMMRQDKVGRISGLYAIIDTGFLEGRSHSEIAAQVVAGGAKVVQLRDKTTAKGELLAVARELRELCTAANVLFVVNDHLDIALAADADGLHLGQEDLPVAVARRILPIDKLIGCSVVDAAQAAAAEADGADYIAAGAIYPTTSREAIEVIGLEVLGKIKKKVALPLVAIGGITGDNAAAVQAAGADSVAVISAILQARSPEKAARQIVNRFGGTK